MASAAPASRTPAIDPTLELTRALIACRSLTPDDAGAQTIIARDAHLTGLKKPFGINILTPRKWLSTLPRETRRKLA